MSYHGSRFWLPTLCLLHGRDTPTLVIDGGVLSSIGFSALPSKVVKVGALNLVEASLGLVTRSPCSQVRFRFGLML
jgi:hypothetical protein